MRKDKAAALLAKMQQATSEIAISTALSGERVSESLGESTEAPNNAARTLTASGEAAKPRRTTVYLSYEDEMLLRQVTASLATQGRRANDSLILRMGLRQLKTGDALLKVYDDTLKLDGRFKKGQ